MTKKLSIVALLLTAIFWPLSFLLNNPNNYLHFFTPLVFTAISYFCLKSHPRWLGIAFLFLALFYPSYLLIPIIFFLIFSFFHPKQALPFLLISLVVFIVKFSSFQTVSNLHLDYQALQKVLGNINLYPAPWYARIMQNKPKIILDKVLSNLFALIDPNNYFFSFHPRELRTNQSLIKLPFASLPFLLFGLYHLPKHPNKKSLAISLISVILGLSFLNNFDRYDLILYPFLLGLLVYGVRQARRQHPQLFKVFLLAFFLFTSIEFVRLLILYV